MFINISFDRDSLSGHCVAFQEKYSDVLQKHLDMTLLDFTAIMGFKVTVVQVCFLNTFDNRTF